MNSAVISKLAISITVIFILGFALLFFMNPQVYHELNNLSLASYNVPGMEARSWAAFAYVITGILNIAFGVALARARSASSGTMVGKVLLICCGAIWMSFGLFGYDSAIESHNAGLLARIVIFVASSFLGLLLLGVEDERIAKDILLKWFTLSSAILIGALSVLSLFIYNDITWVRINLIFLVYFTWFAGFGLRILAMSRKRAAA